MQHVGTAGPLSALYYWIASWSNLRRGNSRQASFGRCTADDVCSHYVSIKRSQGELRCETWNCVRVQDAKMLQKAELTKKHINAEFFFFYPFCLFYFIDLFVWFRLFTFIFCRFILPAAFQFLLREALCAACLCERRCSWTKHEKTAWRETSWERGGWKAPFLRTSPKDQGQQLPVLSIVCDFCLWHLAPSSLDPEDAKPLK